MGLKTRLTLLRHGESAGNLEKRIQGQQDFPLTARGVVQAEEIARRWHVAGVRFDGIIASPSQRASQTAQIVCQSLPAPLEFDPDWMERSFGELEGLLLAEIDRLEPPVDFYQPYQPAGVGGESLLDLHRRAGRALQAVLRRPAGHYLVVSHGATLNMTFCGILGIQPGPGAPRFRFGNTGYVEVEYDWGRSFWSVLNFVGQDAASVTLA